MYNLEPSLNHDKCVSYFNGAGIYMILDVNSPLDNGSLNRGEPWTSYNPVYFKQVFGIIEAFKSYPNVLGFFAGNEVINEDAQYLVPAYVRVRSPFTLPILDSKDAWNQLLTPARLSFVI